MVLTLRRPRKGFEKKSSASWNIANFIDDSSQPHSFFACPLQLRSFIAGAYCPVWCNVAAFSHLDRPDYHRANTMPRIPHSTLLRAYKISPLLPLVLRGTRDFPLAIRELRWMVEHVQDEFKKNPAKFKSGGGKGRLKTLCKRREKSEPLQYILGSQPFGPLDIKCRRGVLIPRCVFPGCLSR